MSPLDELLADARQAAPTPLAERDIRQVAERALLAGAGRHRRWTLQRVTATSGMVAALVAAAFFLVIMPRVQSGRESGQEGVVSGGAQDVHAAVPNTAAAEGEPSELELMSGDRIVAGPGARFHVDVSETDDRRVRLDEGGMLFDVRQIGGSLFAVETPDVEVIVVGTVFSVHVGGGGTTVRVYEGRVEVRGTESTQDLGAGEVAYMGEGDATLDALEARGVEAARARTVAARHDRVVRGHGSPDRTESDGEQRTVQASGEASTEGVHEQEPSGRGASGASRVGQRREAAHGGPALSAARRWLGQGEPERALVAARESLGDGEVAASGGWRMIEGDALRALGRFEEAAAAYGLAAGQLAPPRRQQAGFLEARVRATHLADLEGALRALQAGQVTVPASPLRERGLVLEADLLARLGRMSELSVIAVIYLRDYPDGASASVMRAHLARQHP